MLKGIDVSHAQGNGILWPQVKASGHDFAFAKATEGATFVDPAFARNRAAAAKAGVALGAYHFYRYRADWGAQAHNFVSVVREIQPGELPPVIDLEDKEYRTGQLNLNLVDATRKVLAFISTVADHLGAAPVIYADRDFIKNFLQDERFAQYPLWVAAYRAACPPVPSPWKQITFWQWNEHGTCPGVYGDVDLDYFLGDADALNALRVAVKA